MRGKLRPCAYAGASRSRSRWARWRAAARRPCTSCRRRRSRPARRPRRTPRPGGSPRSATVPKASCPTRPAVWSPWRCAIRPCSPWSTPPPASCAGASSCRARRAISRSRAPAARCWRRPSRPTACSRSRSPTGRSAASVRVGAHPHDVTPAANAVLVGDERGNALSVVRGGQVTATAKVATQPGGVAALDGGRRVAVVSVRERVLEVFDTRTLRRIGRAPAGVGPTHVACLERGPCYVVDTRGGALLVFSVGAGVEPTRRYALPGGPVRHRARSGPPPALRHASRPQRAGRARRSWAPARRATLAHRAPAGLGGGRRAHGRRVRHGAGGRGARARDALTRTR